MTRIFAAILAGGAASRLGFVRKGELRVGGQRLIERVARRLDGVEPALLVATGQSSHCPLPPPALAIRDAADRPTGPLAGLRAVAAYLDASGEDGDMLVSVAVDTPFLPVDFVPRLIQAAQASGAAFSTWGENFYPTNGAWRIAALRKVLAQLADSAGPKDALTLADAVRVDWADTCALDPFANANSLTDLLVLQRRALSGRSDGL